MTISTTKMGSRDTSDRIKHMTERESHEQGRVDDLFSDTKGLPTGEQNPEDVPDVHAYLPPEELEGINRVAEELQMTLEQGIDTIPVDLVLPDEPEPPFPSVNAQGSERL